MIKLLALILSLVLVSCSSGQKVSSDSSISKEVPISESEQKKQKEVESEINKSLKTDVSLAQERFKNALQSKNENALLVAGAELLNKNSKDEKVLLGLGQHYLDKNFPDVAKIFYSRVLENNPDHSDANNNLGVISLKEGRESEAIVYFKKALASNSRNLSASINLGNIYLKYHDYEKAERYLEYPYKRDSKNYNVGNNYAIALRGTGQLDKALSVYKSIEGRSSNSISLLNQAILLAEFKKDFKAAREITSKIRFITTDPSILRKVNALVLYMDQSESRK